MNATNAINATAHTILSGDPAKAYELAQLAASDAPRSVAARINLALAETDPAAAAVAYREAVRLDGENWHALFLQGTQLLRDGRPQEAYWSLAGALARGGDAAELYLLMIRALEQLGRNEQAVEVAVRGVAKNATDGVMHLELGRLLALTGKWEVAVEELEEGLRLNRGPVARPFLDLGVAYYKVGRYEDANTAFATADRMDRSVFGTVEVELWSAAQARMN